MVPPSISVLIIFFSMTRPHLEQHVAPRATSEPLSVAGIQPAKDDAEPPPERLGDVRSGETAGPPGHAVVLFPPLSPHHPEAAASTTNCSASSGRREIAAATTSPS